MTDKPSSDTAGPDLRTLVRIAGLIVTAIWVISVLSVVTALAGMHNAVTLTTILVALLGTPVFVIFVLPALIYNRWGGPAGAKAGAALLLIGAVAVAALPLWMPGMPIFR